MLNLHQKFYTELRYVGAFTSLFAAIIALVQTDIKRKISLPFLKSALWWLLFGVSGYEGHYGLGYMSSMFHLFTHAMFKALLFLGAGSDYPCRSQQRDER